MNGVAEPALGFSEFHGLMAGLGPFEPAPRVAVGVSGGADSLALAVLLNDWAVARGGAVVGLVVDHGLRRGSAAEAHRTARTLGGLGIDHRVLVWRGAKPAANLQAEARTARYRLLSGWCERQGVLHLALAALHRQAADRVVAGRIGRQVAGGEVQVSFRHAQFRPDAVEA